MNKSISLEESSILVYCYKYENMRKGPANKKLRSRGFKPEASNVYVIEIKTFGDFLHEIGNAYNGQVFWNLDSNSKCIT